VRRRRRQDAPIDRDLNPRPVRRLDAVAVAADSLDEPAATMAGVEGLEDRMPSSSVTEYSRALGNDAIGGDHLEEEQQISQVSYLIRSLFLLFVCFLTYMVHISQNIMLVTIWCKRHFVYLLSDIYWLTSHISCIEVFIVERTS
jgi:hypothetical protein